MFHILIAEWRKVLSSVDVLAWGMATAWSGMDELARVVLRDVYGFGNNAFAIVFFSIKVKAIIIPKECKVDCIIKSNGHSY